MGREQGDHLTNAPVMYTAEINGKTEERPAYTEADKVNLAARGWVPKTEKPDGKRAPAASVPSPRVEQANTASGTA